jgi:hypothetical protein
VAVPPDGETSPVRRKAFLANQSVFRAERPIDKTLYFVFHYNKGILPLATDASLRWIPLLRDEPIPYGPTYRLDTARSGKV